MAREIPDVSVGGNFPPTAELRDNGVMLKGVILGHEQRDLGFGLKPIYRIQVLDASCKFRKEKVEVRPEEGTTVEVIVPTRLARQLEHVKEGETVTIVNQGTKKVGRGKPAHVFAVTVE